MALPDRPRASSVARTAIDALESELGPLETYARSIDHAPRFPSEAWAALARHHLLGLTISTADGGRGLSALEAGRSLFELAHRGGTLFAKLSLQPEFCSVLLREGSPEHREAVFRRIARGELLVGNQVTEPEAGSDAAALTTTATRTDAGYRLTGTKSQAAFATEAELALVYARVDGSTGISAFLVPQRGPGVVRRAIPDLGERWMLRGTVEYHDVGIPLTSRVGAEGQAFDALKDELTHERALLGAIYLGVAWHSWEETIEYVGERSAFGRPLAAQEAIAFPLVEDEARLRSTWMLVESTLERIDHGEGTPGDAARSKWLAASTAQTAIDHALQFHGGRGYSEELPFAQRFRDLRSARVAHGTDEIMHLVAARERWPRGRAPSEAKA
jgi:cyclohexanecarboxyl-CoA dehydrogenase